MSQTLDINKLLEKYTEEDVREYAKKLFKELTAITEVVEKQAAEIVKLQMVNKELSENADAPVKIDDAELIARTQLRILVGKSLLGELNTEESKRVELYTKVLLSLSSNKKDSEFTNKAKKLDTNELLNLINNDKQ